MSKGIRCVTIIHPTDEIRGYREMAGFFRLIGVFVCEKMEWMDTGDETDVVISLLEKNKPKMTSDILELLSERLGEYTVRVLKIVGKIYLKHDLMRGSYALEFFKNCNNITIYNDMIDAYDHFSDALRQLENLEKIIRSSENLSLKYVLTAQANCQRRMSQLYTILWDAADAGYYGNETDKYKNILWDKKFYFIADIAKLIKRILEIDPECYGAYAIMALTEIVDPEAKVSSMSDFEKAVSILGNQSHSSYLRYRMGRYYEYILERPKKSLMNYQKSYEVDKYNYRAVYKLAVREQSIGNFNTSIEYWDKIIAILSHKKNSKALQPAECNYLFKAYKNKGIILFEQKKYEECYLAMKEAEKLYHNKNNEKADGVYPFMFGEHALIYKDAAKKKLSIWRLYEFLAKVSPILGKYDEYKKYRDYAERFKPTYGRIKKV